LNEKLLVCSLQIFKITTAAQALADAAPRIQRINNRRLQILAASAHNIITAAEQARLELIAYLDGISKNKLRALP